MAVDACDLRRGALTPARAMQRPRTRSAGRRPPISSFCGARRRRVCSRSWCWSTALASCTRAAAAAPATWARSATCPRVRGLSGGEG